MKLWLVMALSPPCRYSEIDTSIFYPELKPHSVLTSAEMFVALSDVFKNSGEMINESKLIMLGFHC
jgi:hypothetical protein